MNIYQYQQVFRLVCYQLSVTDIFNLSMTNKTLNKICLDPVLWTYYLKRDYKTESNNNPIQVYIHLIVTDIQGRLEKYCDVICHKINQLSNYLFTEESCEEIALLMGNKSRILSCVTKLKSHSIKNSRKVLSELYTYIQYYSSNLCIPKYPDNISGLIKFNLHLECQYNHTFWKSNAREASVGFP